MFYYDKKYDRTYQTFFDYLSDGEPNCVYVKFADGICGLHIWTETDGTNYNGILRVKDAIGVVDPREYDEKLEHCDIQDYDIVEVWELKNELVSLFSLPAIHEAFSYCREDENHYGKLVWKKREISLTREEILKKFDLPLNTILTIVEDK